MTALECAAVAASVPPRPGQVFPAKQKRESRDEHPAAWPHEWRWATVADPNQPGPRQVRRAPRIPRPLADRCGQPCRALVRGRNGNLLIEFEDGHQVVAPRHAVRRREIPESER